MNKNTAAVNRAICSLIFPAAVLFIFVSCTFDYGESGSSGNELPDLIMVNVEYVRVRSSDPIARFQAERAERYDTQGVMKLENLSFEQYGERGETTNVTGNAGFASVNIESGDIHLDNGVTLEVESEDIVIETIQLEWKDEPRTLESGKENEVTILRRNGTKFTGVGLLVNARKREWEFLGAASGTYIHDDDDDEFLSITENE